jgi:aspartyl-tRNA(Asn)/glutamyl-tRNA(Gln) amidotransferase subunit A
MNKVEIEKLDIKSAHNHLINGDFSAVELAKECIRNVEKKNKDINAYLEVYDDVIEQAEQADKKIRNKKDVTLLTGIPIALKDNILNDGKITSAGSKILENYRAVYDATVVKRLKDNGALILGRTNLDEFAMGSSTEHSAYGVTKNPYDESRVAGGSSGGSAAAVAINGALGALGSDTGGSIRQPASFCGVVGLKPTYGAISRYGLIAMGSSLDQIGSFGKTVGDVEAIFNAVVGKDEKDSTSLEHNKEITIQTKDKLIIGIPTHFMEDGIDDDVLENFKQALEKFKSKGYAVKEIKLPNVKYALAAYYIIMPAEASSNLARFDGVKYGLHKGGKNLIEDYFETRGAGFGQEVRRRILLGTYVLSAGYYDAYYTKAMSVRRLISEDYRAVFDKSDAGVDVVLTPTTPTPAFKIGEKSDPLSMYLSDIFTVPANLTGLPALSVPSGTVEREGVELPIGMQISGPRFSEKLLFRAGKDFLNESN